MKPQLFKILVVFNIALIISSCVLQKTEKPKLVITITVDQLGQQLLYHYKDHFTSGLKKIMINGSYYKNAVVDHAITNSFPGHSSIATGMHPKNHGIIDNMWGEKRGDSIHVVRPSSSDEYKLVNNNKYPGYSPRYLKTNTLADYIMNEYPESKIVSIGSDVVAGLYMGKQKGHAYWYDPRVGQFVSSTCFLDAYDEWINSFNKKFQDTKRANTIWNLEFSNRNNNTIIPSDDRSFENGGINYMFPHIFSKEEKSHNRWFSVVPILDKAALELSQLAVNKLELGKDESPDLLAISLKVTDRIGHKYGPYSLEQYENLLHLDENLGAFIGFLDNTIGGNDYMLVLTADHGAVKAPEQSILEGQDGYRVSKAEMNSVFKRIEKLESEPHTNSIIQEVQLLLQSQPFVKRTFSQSQLLETNKKDTILKLYQNSFIMGKTPIFPMYNNNWRVLNKYGITVMFNENTSSYLATSIHGTPYYYDRNVPIIFYGKNRKLNPDLQPRTIDITPTLLNMLQIEPIKLDGQSLIQ